MCWRHASSPLPATSANPISLFPGTATSPHAQTDPASVSTAPANRFFAIFSRHSFNLSSVNVCSTTSARLSFRPAPPSPRNLPSPLSKFVQLFLDLDVRHHLAADLAEAAQAVGDARGNRPRRARRCRRSCTSRRATPRPSFPADPGIPASRSARAPAAARSCPSGSGSHVSGSTIRTPIPGQRMADRCRAWRRPAGNRAARKSRVFTATAGEHSVQPYPSSGRMPNRSSNAIAQCARAASPRPPSRYRRLPNSSGAQRADVRLQERRRRQQERTRYLRTSAPIARASSGLGWKTTPMPSTAGRQSVPVNPNEWKNGRMPRMRSPSPSMNVCSICSTLDAMLKCVSITPLGSPVLPLEKITVARSSSAGRRRCAQQPLPASAPATTTRQAAPHSASPHARFVRQFLQQNVCAGTAEFTFSRNAFDVTTVFSSHCSRARRQHLVRRRVVQIDRHLAQQQRGQIHQRARNRRRQQNANHLLSVHNARSRRARKMVSSAPRRTSPSACVHLPWQTAADAAAPSGRNARAASACALAMLIRVRAKFLHRLPHFAARGGRRHRLAEGHASPVRNPPRHFHRNRPRSKS